MSSKLNSKLLTPLLALAIFLSFSQLGQAEDIADPPRSQKVGNYTVEFITPQPNSNHDAENDILFQFRVLDATGKPAQGLNLQATAIRDYSGQVKKEHNGPRTPNIGPLALKETATPGIYQTTIRFGFVGHWYVQVDGVSFPEKTFAKFRTPVGAPEGKGQGIGLDWLTWLGVLLTVIGIVVFIGRKGATFAAPPEELETPRPAALENSSVATEKTTVNNPDPVKK